MVVFLKFPEAKWRMPGMQEGGAYAMIPCTTALVFQDWFFKMRKPLAKNSYYLFKVLA